MVMNMELELELLVRSSLSLVVFIPAILFPGRMATAVVAGVNLGKSSC